MTERTRQADPSAIRLSRRLKTFFRCSREFFQAQGEQELLQSICEIVVTGDDLRLAWVGYSENDFEKNIRPVAKAGYGLDFLEQVKISWGEGERAQDPAGIAVRTSTPYRINDLQADPKDSPWRSAAVAQGFASCVALPLVAHHKQLGAVDLQGALSLYAAKPEAFDDSAIEYYAELAACLTRAVTMLRGDLAGGLAYDLTALRAAEERRRAEDALRSARIELARAMQMTAMGQMAASIAHEINQPLAAIVANGNAGLNWLARATPDLDEAREALKCIVNDGHLAGEVIGGIRSMFKKNGQAEAPQDVNELVREALALLRGEIQGQQISIRSELAEELPRVPANRVQLQQVIVNLIMNAVDAMSAVADRERILRVTTEIHGFSHVLIKVEDSGTGIDPKNINRVFEAFFTTKSHGMGMGLSICRSIIESHGGRLWASPGQPHGSIFHVLLPTGASVRNDENGNDRAP
jgi:C4-dicarboxylate-specific signal transduction histidine kinase